MDKIVTYIKSGKGNGLLFLVATALITTIFWMFLFKQIYNDIKPQILIAADDILPITVKNSQITEPLENYKKIDIKLGSEEGSNNTFPVILDTREEIADTTDIPVGLFLDKNGATLKIPNEIKRIPYQDGLWDKAAVEEFLNYFSTVFSLIISLIMVAILSLILIVKTIIAAAFGKYIISPLAKDTTFTFPMFMRLCAILISVTELLLLLISFASGIRIGIIPQILVISLLTYGFLMQTKKQTE